MIEFPIEGQNATTGARGKIDPLLQERRMDAVGTQLGVLLEALDGVHRFQVGLESALVPGARFILKARKLFFGPASQCSMDRLP